MQIVFLFIFLLGCSNVNKKSDSNDSVHLVNSDTPIAKDNTESLGVFSGVYAFDVSQTYPEKEISIQSIAEVEYIPLETRDDMLMRRRDTKYLDENEIIATNGKDIMFFNRNGSALYSFNRSGGSGEEYSEVSGIAYDKKNNEVFILDRITQKRVKVYTKKGEFKRSFPVSSPSGKYVYGFLSVDDDHLVCFSPKEPNVLISKKNGHIIKVLQTSFKESLGTMIHKGKLRADAMYPSYGRALNGYILTDLSSDSTYILTSNNELELFSIRKPAIHNMEVQVFLLPCLETSNYYFASTLKREYDFEKNIGFPYEVLMYDKADSKIFNQKLYNSDYTNKKYNEIDDYSTILPPKQFLIAINADKLIEEYKNNKLKGRLKEIASKLKDEDNPVLMLITFK